METRICGWRFFPDCGDDSDERDCARPPGVVYAPQNQNSNNHWISSVGSNSNSLIINTTPKGVIVLTEGDTLEIFCTASGPTTSYVEWIGSYTRNADILKTDNSALIKKENVQKSDSGTYICRVNSGNLTETKEVRVVVLTWQEASRPSH